VKIVSKFEITFVRTMINVNLCMDKQHYDFLKPYIIHFSFLLFHRTTQQLPPCI